MEQANDSDGREEAVAEKTTKRENAVPTEEEAPEYTETEPTPIWISRRTRMRSSRASQRCWCSSSAAVPAHQARRGSRRDSLGRRLSRFLLPRLALHRLQRGLRRPRYPHRAAPLLLHLGGGPAVGRRGERGDLLQRFQKRRDRPGAKERFLSYDYKQRAKRSKESEHDPVRLGPDPLRPLLVAFA